MSTDIYEALNFYGVSYEGEQGEYTPTVADVTLGELAAQGGRITRVRWIGGEYIPGRGKCYDLCYVHGQIRGEEVSVRLDGLENWALVPKHQRKGEMIAWAKAWGVFAKGLGLLDDSNWSTLG